MVADIDITDLVDRFRRDGYVHIKGVFTDAQLAEYQRLRETVLSDWQFTHGTAKVPSAVADLVERHPRAALAAVANAVLLDFAEQIMGPVVQLDSVVLNADPIVDSSLRGQPVSWHRDRFGFFPLGVYTRPWSIVLIAYLQEMTDEVGPLRVIPVSHREPIRIDPEDLQVPHPEEVLVRTSPGDIVAIHHNLLHSGTRNTSSAERRFLGFIYNVSSLLHEDNFNGPNCQALLATARRMHDRRMLRLLGEDELIVPRQNSGFTAPDELGWQEWRYDDEKHAADAWVARQEVEQARSRLA